MSASMEALRGLSTEELLQMIPDRDLAERRFDRVRLESQIT
jgi:hypothetical protein